MTDPPSTILDELIDAIVKAVPELQGAQLPCISISKDQSLKLNLNDESLYGGTVIEEEIKITQFRPNLEDVLLACAKIDQEMFVNERGGICGYVFEAEGWTQVQGRDNAFWHLGKPLSEQSPETISFLHSLLKENNLLPPQK